MRKNATRLVLLVITLTVLSGIVLLKNIITSYIGQNVSAPFKQIRKEGISEVLLQYDKKETRLYKNKNEWALQKDGVEYRADQDLIDSLLNSFVNLQKGEIASNNKNKHVSFGIETKKISVRSKSQEFIVYVGNVAGLNKNYVRINNENEVFVASGFTEAFSHEDYRDLRVNLIQNEDRIGEVEISFDYEKLLLAKKNNEWYSNEKKLKKERVDFFLNDLKTLKSTDILKETPFLGSPSLTIKLKENGQQKTAEFFLPADRQGQKDANSYFLKTSASEKIFQIDGVYVASLKKQEKDFTE